MTTLSAPVPADSPDRASTSDLIAVLRDRAPKLALAFAAGQAAWPAARWARNKARSLTTYTVKVSGVDAVYDDLHSWVLGLLPPARQRALVAWSSKRSDYPAAPDDDGRRPPTQLRLRYDGTREQAIRVAGHTVRVLVTENALGGDERHGWRPPEIVFTMSTPAARDALLAEISGVLERGQSAKRRPSFRMLDQWGDWARLDDLPPRTLDSVILPGGQLERIISDESGGVTLSGLLNTLDGLATPHGLLFVLTSNKPEALDYAVVQAGRVDLVEHFGLADEDQVRRLVSRWFGHDLADAELASRETNDRSLIATA